MIQKRVALAAEGTIVWRWENYEKTAYIIAMHDYAKTQNGPGYTLLVRLEPLAETRAWSTNSSASITWADCSLREWLNRNFLERLEPEEAALAQTITLPWLTEVQDTYFVLDTYELIGGQKEPLPPNVIRILAEKNNARAVWGQNSKADTHTSSDGSSSDQRFGYYWWQSKSSALGTIRQDAAECDGLRYVQPCFVVKADQTAILDDGMLEAAPPPEIRSDYFGSDVTIVKRGGFQVPYKIQDKHRERLLVTERLDGKFLHGYNGTPGITNWCTVDGNTFAALAEGEDHLLTVQVSNGASCAEKTFRFRKSVNLGYVLYMGKITGTEDGQSYYWTERQVLHNAHDPDAPVVLDPELNLEKNNFGSLTFTLPAGNPCHETIGPKKTVVSVEEDGTEIWCGYVTELTPGFDLSIEVYCEGELGFLQDRDVEVEERVYTAAELTTLALTAGEDFAKEGKTFLPGTITMEKPESAKDKKESKAISSGWDILDTNLVKNYGGYLRLRKEIKMENGKTIYTRYLDYLRTIPDRTGQTIEFGVNMRDLSYYMKVNTLVNSVKVIGFKTSGWWIFSHTDQIVRTKKNEKSIEAYGLVERTYTVDGTASTTESLDKIAQEKLDEYRSGLSSGLTIDAADLADTGVNIDRLDFLKNTRIISAPHGLDDWVLCTKLTIPLDAPEDKSFTFGDSTDALSTMQAVNYGTAGKAWNAIQTTIQYVKSGG